MQNHYQKLPDLQEEETKMYLGRPVRIRIGSWSSTECRHRHYKNMNKEKIIPTLDLKIKASRF